MSISQITGCSSKTVNELHNIYNLEFISGSYAMLHSTFVPTKVPKTPGDERLSA